MSAAKAQSQIWLYSGNRGPLSTWIKVDFRADGRAVQTVAHNGVTMPAAEMTYSKGQIRRAGRFFRDLHHQPGPIDTDDFLAAVDVIDWWRALHARPLARTNAGLRYYVRKVGVPEPDVTQRLKRFSTIVDKLRREPTMQLTTMEDIGGVRTVLPDQACVDALVADIRGQPRWTLRRVREYVQGRDPGPK